MAELTDRYVPGFKSLHALMPDILSPVERAAVDLRIAEICRKGRARAGQAMAASVLGPLTTAADLVDLAEASELAAARRRPGSTTPSARPSPSTGCGRRRASSGPATSSSGRRCAG